jgi:hypothetical protein
MDKGITLAIDVITIYLLLGPFVFLGLYILFDRLAERDPDVFRKKDDNRMHPDLWSATDMEEYFAKKAFFTEVSDRMGK